MKTRTTMILAALAVVIAATAATARPGKGAGCHDGPAGRGERLEAMLDLSESQAAAVRTLREERREAGADRRKAIMKLEHQIRGQMLEDDPDQGELTKLLRRVGELKTEQKVDRMRMRLKIREILTEEQRDRLLLKRGKHGKHGKRGGGHRCGGAERCGPGPDFEAR